MGLSEGLGFRLATCLNIDLWGLIFILIMQDLFLLSLFRIILLVIRLVDGLSASLLNDSGY